MSEDTMLSIMSVIYGYCIILGDQLDKPLAFLVSFGWYMYM